MAGMSVLLGLVLIVGGFVGGDGDGGLGDLYDGDGGVGDDGQFLTLLMAGTSQQAHWRRNVCFTWSGYSCWWFC